MLGWLAQKSESLLQQNFYQCNILPATQTTAQINEIQLYQLKKSR